MQLRSHSAPENFRVPPAPRKLPQQSRSRMLVASVKQACLKIVRERGPGHLKIMEIEQVSGAAMGSIYQYFPNVDAIVAAIYEDRIRDHIDRTRLKLATEWRELALRERVRAMVRDRLVLHRRLLDLDAEFGRDSCRRFDLRSWFARVAGNPDSFAQLFREAIEPRGSGVEDGRLGELARELETVLGDSIIETMVARPEQLCSPAFENELLETGWRILGIGSATAH